MILNDLFKCPRYSKFQSVKYYNVSIMCYNIKDLF